MATWICDHCKLINYPSTSQCIACFRQAEIQSTKEITNTRKYRSILLVFGYTRHTFKAQNIKQQILPKAIIKLFHTYYFQPWQAIWSSIYKAKEMTLYQKMIQNVICQ